MVKASGPEIIYDPSSTFSRRPSSGASAREWRNFMSPSLKDMYKKPTSTELTDKMDFNDEELDIRKMMKEIEFLGAQNMSWKERKELENRKVVSLGGKPPKERRLPLSVAKVVMKKQKEREQKVSKEGMMLGWSGKNENKNSRETKHKAEKQVLKASEGHFKKGVLNVEHLLRAPSSSSSSSRDGQNMPKFGKRKNKKGNGKKGNKKGKKGKKKH